VPGTAVCEHGAASEHVRGPARERARAPVLVVLAACGLSLAAVHPSWQALFDYSAMEADELTLVRGETMVIYGSPEEGWYECELRGRVGMIPANYVRLLHAAELRYASLNHCKPAVAPQTVAGVAAQGTACESGFVTIAFLPGKTHPPLAAREGGEGKAVGTGDRGTRMTG
jgi:hypothetical protein